MTQHATQPCEPTFAFNLIAPYETFHNGQPQRIPYIIDGLLTEGGFSALGGKSKYGKSSFARYEAVCIAKGIPCLGRDTQQGEVIFFNLEDPRNHMDNCLAVLDYDPKADAKIQIIEKLAPTVSENVSALGDLLTRMPNVRFVVIDTLAKFIRVPDLNDYMPVLTAVEQLHGLARRFPHLHIQGTAHCKKVKTDDPFDGLLGSTALRAEPDTNLSIYGEGGQRIIATETRVGRSLPPTLLQATMQESAGATVVSHFELGTPETEWQKRRAEKTQHKQKLTHEQRIIDYLQKRPNLEAPQALTLDEVAGKNSYKTRAIQELVAAGVVTVTGTKQSRTDPLKLKLNKESLKLNDFIDRYADGSDDR